MTMRHGYTEGSITTQNGSSLSQKGLITAQNSTIALLSAELDAWRSWHNSLGHGNVSHESTRSTIDTSSLESRLAVLEDKCHRWESALNAHHEDTKTLVTDLGAALIANMTNRAASGR